MKKSKSQKVAELAPVGGSAPSPSTKNYKVYFNACEDAETHSEIWIRAKSLRPPEGRDKTILIADESVVIEFPHGVIGVDIP